MHDKRHSLMEYAGSNKWCDEFGNEFPHFSDIVNSDISTIYAKNYSLTQPHIMNLYESGKKNNWNASYDIDWSQSFPTSEPFVLDVDSLAINNYPPFARLPRDKKVEFSRKSFAWNVSQFLHGEQGALLIASQLVSCVPDIESKMYAASQSFDEARHVEVLTKYLCNNVRFMYPISNKLNKLLNLILSDSRWDIKLLGMQVIIEGMALSAFVSIKDICRDKLFVDILERIIADEGRHLNYGVSCLEKTMSSLTESERRVRADIALQACTLLKDRLFPEEVYEEYGFDVSECIHHVSASESSQKFRRMLFSRVVPNLKKLGLITPETKIGYRELGILEYENIEVDSLHYSRPLDTQK
jgi:hypothetical protein